ncbi:alkaline phosphatase PafA [Gelidibacter maritimus]|uniref:Alkaline phosphatase family protein n=1 Tax=Gelidibacter maritimus TaxID=2761487 RepID=A0A7W2M5K5_9FLAO|nr:alkaline phosphatase PafA [Gelidibacter maritimus]MBA6153108.1 alkaline phosphatase family protein [Gelidibacter maritimus]
MKIKTLTLVVILFLQNSLYAQNNSIDKQQEKPKLVIGIVVDQMRADYVYRYWNKYGNNGFKKLVNQGFIFKNNHYNYIPTYTAPGHASIFTGTSPMNHGIIANEWFDKQTAETIYCVSDPGVSPVGTTSKAGAMSPHRLKSTTITDENRLSSQFRGKTIGIALKDRSAILPAGHTANAAYWFHGENEGKWITSSYYMQKLPKWVTKFNNSRKVDEYLKVWDTYYDIESYTESGPDINNFEKGFKGKETASFPYDLKALKAKNGGYDILKSVAYGGDLTTDFAIAAIDGEKLGQGENTDFLTISYSNTDYIGHNFGVNSKELQDAYIRLDLNIATLIDHLDKQVGKGKYTLFLTSDHGAAEVPSYLESVKIPAYNFNTGAMRNALKTYLEEKYGIANLISNVSNNQIFFNHSALRNAKINAKDLERDVAEFVLATDMVDKVYVRSQMLNGYYNSGIASMLQNGYDHNRSGDVLYILEPGTIPTVVKKGTTHGSGHTYDTHVPLIFYGHGVKHGSTSEYTSIVDIAPTVSNLLNIPNPNGVSGQPLFQLLD